MATGGSVRDITRLPEPLKAPEQRWHKLPTRSKSESSPLRLYQASHFNKTPKDRKTKSVHITPSRANSGTPHPTTTPKTTTPKVGTTPSSSVTHCRFIPKRPVGDEYGSFLLLRREILSVDTDKENEREDEEGDSKECGDKCEIYRNALLMASLQGSVPRGVLTFKTVTPNKGSVPQYVTSGGLGSSASLSQSLVQQYTGTRERRKICPNPEKILDAPELVNDYYLNLLDWSAKNIVAIALGPSLYLWDGETGQAEQPPNIGYEDTLITSVCWAEKGRFLAIGLSNGSIQLYDADKKKKVRTMRGHKDRVSSLNWSGHILASGSRSGEIHLHDVRQQIHLIKQLNFHTMEVCGLKWSPDGHYLASGGNDNEVLIWSPLVKSEPVQVLSGHQAAVKVSPLGNTWLACETIKLMSSNVLKDVAIAWCPWQNHLLATGGGTRDKMVHFWDVHTGECLQSMNTKSQVSSIMWCKEHQELITSHGHPRHQLTIWKYPSMTKITELKGHGDRVLHMSISPNKTRIISAGADETLRIWKCFKKPSSLPTHEDSMTSLLQSGIH